jgi:hypothetical protein
MEAELLASARYGELQELNDLWCAEIEQKADLWPTTNTDAQDRLCAWLTVKDEFGGNTMLHYACANHHAGMAILLKFCSHQDSRRSCTYSSFLFREIIRPFASSFVDIVAFLLDLDKKHNAGLVNLKNKEGNTPLHWCTVTLSHATDKDAVLSITKGLLEAGASTLVSFYCGCINNILFTIE